MGMMFLATSVMLSVVKWGVPEQVEPASPADRLREIAGQYDRREHEDQFLVEHGTLDLLKVPADATHAEIQRRKDKRRADLIDMREEGLASNESLALHVEMIGLFGDHPEALGEQPGLQTGECAGGAEGSRVFVSLLVPASMTLQALHDKALAPALGFRRRYHAYYFTDPTDGAQFGICTYCSTTP